MNRKINSPVTGAPAAETLERRLIGAPRTRLRSIQVAGARSAGSALPGRFATGIAANHAVATCSKSSAGV